MLVAEICNEAAEAGSCKAGETAARFGWHVAATLACMSLEAPAVAADNSAALPVDAVMSHPGPANARLEDEGGVMPLKPAFLALSSAALSLAALRVAK